MRLLTRTFCTFPAIFHCTHVCYSKKNVAIQNNENNRYKIVVTQCIVICISKECNYKWSANFNNTFLLVFEYLKISSRYFFYKFLMSPLLHIQALMYLSQCVFVYVCICNMYRYIVQILILYRFTSISMRRICRIASCYKTS